MRRQAGFTLVEIAIVLVIIGLLLGGILKGQELITQARIKNIVNDMNGVSAAVYSYQDRYRAVPGDDKTACTRWNNQTYPGDGNGAVDQATTPAAACGTYSASPVPKENTLFWQHLRLAGLIGGDASNADEPLNAAGGKIVIWKDPFAGGGQMKGLTVCATKIAPKIAAAIDSQFDDGVANQGSVRGVENEDLTAAVTTAYVDDAAKVYSVCKTL
jgi:prepilin-type N-terminal cleavage/methylation domain-containing protein